MQTSRLKLITLIVTLLLMASCAPTTGKPTNHAAQHVTAGSENSTRRTPYTRNPFESSQAQEVWQKAAKSIDAASLRPDELWALANCQCSDEVIGKFLKHLSQAKGALPQPLMPAMREEISSNAALNILMRLPQGLQNIGNFLTNIFVTDSKIAQGIRDGLHNKIANALPGGTRLKNNIDFRFDGFPSYFGNVVQSTPPQSFEMSTQTPRWAFIFSLPHLWENRQPAAFGDHGVQVLQTALAMSEWQYLFGLERSERNQRVYGGLSISVHDSGSRQLGPFDPRVNGDGPGRYVSGTYLITYPDVGSVDLATNVHEHWTSEHGPASLDEQAQFLYSAARAFSRLRPKSRSAVKGLFAPNTGMFPDNAHQLPLVVLSSVAALLDGPLIDADAVEVFEYARLATTSQGQIGTPAKLSSLARLARASALWAVELKDLSDGGFDAAMHSQLTSASADIKRVAQLAMQRIFSHHVRESYNGSGSIHLVTSPTDGSLPTIAEAAETLATLARIEQAILHSPHLRHKIIALYHNFAEHYITAAVEGRINLQYVDAAWTYTALRQLDQYPGASQAAPWLKSGIELLGKHLETSHGGQL